MDRFSSTEEIQYLPKEFVKGIWARKKNKPIDVNPYTPNSWQDRSYRAGWADEDMNQNQKGGVK